jgi:hypothetical protein
VRATARRRSRRLGDGIRGDAGHSKRSRLGSDLLVPFAGSDGALLRCSRKTWGAERRKNRVAAHTGAAHEPKFARELSTTPFARNVKTRSYLTPSNNRARGRDYTTACLDRRIDRDGRPYARSRDGSSARDCRR